MAKVLVIDDAMAEQFGDYEPFIGQDEVHLAFYLDSIGGETTRSYAEEVIFPRIREMRPLASSVAFTHQQIVPYLREHNSRFDKIFLDGLEGRCFELIEEAKLPLDKTAVVTSSPDVIDDCMKRNLTYMEKA